MALLEAAPDVLLPGTDPVLEVDGLRVRFGNLQVLDGVHLHVDAGEVVALVGENGAGKSTVVRSVAGDLVPDAGTVRATNGLAVVWQDLALCDNLDVAANLFLGHERRRFLLAEEEMRAEAARLLAGHGINIGDVRRPVRTLSGGQRQLVALARAVLARPKLLILDEPTAALGVAEGEVVNRLLKQLHAQGMAMLLASHRLDQVFALADRILVLRGGTIVADVSPLEVHPDDVVALMSGVETDSSARRQLRRLRSLVDQLSGVEPSASLPLILSAAAIALDQDMICLHLLDGGRLRRLAAVGLPNALLDAYQDLPVGPDGGPAGLAVQSGQVVVVDDVRHHPAWQPLRAAAAASGVLSSWAAPIVGAGGVLGAISGHAASTGRPQSDQLELMSLYVSHAAAAIERGRLLAEATRRNRILETLRQILEALAGPGPVEAALGHALAALCQGLGADAVALHVGTARRAAVDAAGRPLGRTSVASRLDRAATAGPEGDDGTAAIALRLPDATMVVSAAWPAGGPDTAARQLLEDAAPSFRLALEREALEAASRETAALRRANVHRREFLSRLNHELRTPLTAIHGYASTLQQPDIVWDDASQARFLGTIADESARMGRLVADLLDFSTIEAGILHLHRDWCDLNVLLHSALACVPAARDRATLDVDPNVGLVWADHDRLEQVLVNLIDNAIRHTGPSSRLWLRATPSPDGSVVVRVADDGPGIPPELAASVFEAHVRGTSSAQAPGAGLGLAIARGIAEAHGARLELEPTDCGASLLLTLPARR